MLTGQTGLTDDSSGETEGQQASKNSDETNSDTT